MHSASFFISPHDLWTLIGTARAPQIVDVRKREIYDAAPGLLPTAAWRDIHALPQWKGELDRARPVVFACRLGHHMSQTPAAELRGEGFDARVLAGGHAAWVEAKLPLVTKATLDRLLPMPRERRPLRGSRTC